jgi:ribosome biogenesis GTPase
MGRRPREQDLTGKYLDGDMDHESLDGTERFNKRAKFQQQNKTAKTTLMRAAGDEAELAKLPVGQVWQVFSVYLEVRGEDGQTYLCTVRKTMQRNKDTAVVVGDRVRYRPSGANVVAGVDKVSGLLMAGQSEGVVEAVLERQTVLTRADSFKALVQHPIVANASHMLIVVALLQPRPKWGLVDRMLIAAEAGKLRPVVCVNKLDLAETAEGGAEALVEARGVLAHYKSMGVEVIESCAHRPETHEVLRAHLAGRTTVLAGHSGVGKSSLVRAVEPTLDLRVAEISTVHDKGKHTTTSARRYELSFGGAVIDTPGVKMFGLWGVDHENVGGFFPDVAAGTAPEWRVESYGRIVESLGPRRA